MSTGLVTSAPGRALHAEESVAVLQIDGPGTRSSGQDGAAGRGPHGLHDPDPAILGGSPPVAPPARTPSCRA